MYRVRVWDEWKFRIPFDNPRCLELFHTAGELNLNVPYLQVEGKGTFT